MSTAENLYLKPADMEEAFRMAKKHEKDFRFIAGGTDAIVNHFQGHAKTTCLIDLTGIPDLNRIQSDEKFMRIGALTRLDDLKKHPVLAEYFPALVEAARAVASPLLRKTATIGGNLLCENRCLFYNQSEWWREAVGYCLKCDGDVCIATGGKKNCFSKFVSDTAPVLIALKASVEILDGIHRTWIPLEDLYSGNGLSPRTIGPSSILRQVILPFQKGLRCIFMKLRPREAVDFTSLTTAVSRSPEGDIRIVVGGVDPGPVLVTGNMNEDPKEWVRQAVKKARIVDNDFYSRSYRREMLVHFLNESLQLLGT